MKNRDVAAEFACERLRRRLREVVDDNSTPSDTTNVVPTALHRLTNSLTQMVLPPIVRAPVPHEVLG
jgi:hypothetical protein